MASVTPPENAGGFEAWLAEHDADVWDAGFAQGQAYGEYGPSTPNPYRNCPVCGEPYREPHWAHWSPQGGASWLV